METSVGRILGVVIRIPLLSKAVTEKPVVIDGPKTKGKKVIFWLVLLFSTLFPALFFPTLMDKAGTGMTILKVSSFIIIGAAVLFVVIAMIRKRGIKSIVFGAPGTVLAGLGLFLMVLKAGSLFKTGSFFNAPTVNQILYWALVVTLIIVILALAVHFLMKNASIITWKQYGFGPNWRAILASFFVALLAVAVGYGLLFGVDALFKTDFRIWVWAAKTFEISQLVAFLKYVPFFFLYYFVTAITMNANTEFMKGWKGYLVGCILNVGGLVLYLILQYGKLFLTGTAMWPAQSLSSILLFALIPTLIVATLYAKVLYKKTGNVYTGAFLNTFLMTMMTVANTVVYNGIK